MPINEDQVRISWACHLCGAVLSLPTHLEPECCSQLMQPGKISVVGGDPDQMRIHLLAVRSPEDKEWAVPPEHTFEVWQLAPGRRDGERIGWIGTHATAVEWISMPGVTIDRGVAPCIQDGVQMLIIALNGGLGAKQEIAEMQVVS